MATLVGIEVVFLSIWTLVDPMHREIERFAYELPKDTTEDIKFLPMLEHCESNNHYIWLGNSFMLLVVEVKDVGIK